MVHVPYKGSQPLIADLVGGHVIMGFDSMMATMPQVRAGRLRAMGVAAPKRSPVAPEVPTLAEAGGPSLTIGSWYGLFAPAGTPRAVVGRLSELIARAGQDAEVKKRLTELGSEPVGNSPEEFAAMLRNEVSTWAAVVKASGATAEE